MMARSRVAEAPAKAWDFRRTIPGLLNAVCMGYNRAELSTIEATVAARRTRIKISLEERLFVEPL
jgi:hypothetical protein